MKNKEPLNGIRDTSHGQDTQPNIFVAHEGRYVKLPLQKVLWISSKGNYAHIVTKERQFTNRISLTNLLKILPPSRFVQIHKGYIVQIDAIDYIHKTNNEVMVNGQFLPIGRSYKAKLFSRLRIIN